MLSLLILFVFGLCVAYFGTQNTNAVDLNLANYFVGKVPLYVIVIGSMLLGIFLSWLISMADTLSSMLRMHGKETELKNAYKTIESLKNDNNGLLLKNAALKDEQKEPYAQKENNENPQEYMTHPSIFSRLKQSVS